MEDEEESWHGKKEFWQDFSFGEELMEKAPEEVEKIIELADLKKGMKLLDLCCGVGRHSLEFAKKDFEVTGVDITRDYLEKANKRAENENIDIEFLREDMRDFRREEEYDAVVNLFSSFGYFKKEEDNIQVLENVFDSLKPEGKFVMDVKGKEIIARIFQERDWYETENGYVLEERKVENDWNYLKTRRIKIMDGEVREHEFGHWLYTAKELKDMIEDVGFDEVDVYSSYDGEYYDREAERLVAVAKKF